MLLTGLRSLHSWEGTQGSRTTCLWKTIPWRRRVEPFLVHVSPLMRLPSSLPPLCQDGFSERFPVGTSTENPVHPLPPHMASPLSAPAPGGTSVTLDGPARARHHHPQSTVCIRLLGVVRPVGWATCERPPVPPCRVTLSRFTAPKPCVCSARASLSRPSPRGPQLCHRPRSCAFSGVSGGWNPTASGLFGWAALTRARALGLLRVCLGHEGSFQLSSSAAWADRCSFPAPPLRDI